MTAMTCRYAAAFWALLLGFGLWASSRLVVGTLEPWDAEWPYYSGVMLVGGAAMGMALPRQAATVFLGLWAGQALALLLPGHDRSWFLLGCVTTGIGSLLGLTGYLACFVAHSGWRKFNPRAEANTEPTGKQDAKASDDGE